MMKTNTVKKILFLGAFCAVLAWAATAGAEVVYYPVTMMLTDPATGAQQQHTIYVPLDTASGTVRGTAGGVVRDSVYDNGQLPSNPWQVTAAGTVAASQTARGAVAADAVQTQPQAAAYNSGVVAVPQTAATVAARGAAAGTGALRDAPLPAYSGTSTTWNTAMGQDAIAPEINKDNMIKMAQHLRALGYQVPDSLDTAIANAPEKTRVALIRATNFVRGGGDNESTPMMKAIGQITRDLEANYGISFENIMDTSMKILDSK